MQRARQDGANVFGYLHWSIADNWEWIDGYRQEARFGLFSVDRSSSYVLPHAITDGALALAYSMENASTTVPAAITRFGRYRPDGAIIEHPSMSPYVIFNGTMDGRPITLLLAAPPAFPTPPPARYTSLFGLLFYGDDRRWIRLKSIVWEPATRTLQFSHPQFTSWPQTPERIFTGTLDPAGQNVGGIASEISGKFVRQCGWQLSRPSLAGMWQVRLGSGASITLSLSCPEGVWRGRVLRATDWNNLENVNPNATGFKATENGMAVGAMLGPGNNLVVSPWGVSLQRLSDGLPF